MLEGLRSHWEFFFQMTHSGVTDVAVDGRSATARWQIQEVARSVDGSQSYDNLAMYFDRLVVIDDGSWRSGVFVQIEGDRGITSHPGRHGLGER